MSTGAHADELSSPPTDTAVARAQFEAFRAGFDAAVKSVGGETIHDFIIGGRRVRLVFAGVAVSSHLLPAFEHLRATVEGDPGLTIRVWDSRSTGIRLSDNCGSLDLHALNGMPNARPSGTIQSAYARPDSGLSMFDAGTNQAIYWLPDGAVTPFEDRSAPLRGILNWWMARNGRQFVHAAAVGTDAGAVLIVGRSGSGKSTTSLACLSAGMRYVSDDYCLVGLEAGPRAYSLFRTAKLHAHNLHRLPHLASEVINEPRLGFEKGVFVLGSKYDAQVTTELPIRAILVPTVKDRDEPAIHPIPRPLALAAIAPSTLLQLSSTRAESMRTMGVLVRAVPTYSIELCRDVTRIPPAISQLLEDLRENA